MGRRREVLLALSVLVLSAEPSFAQARRSGVQESLDGRQISVNKDVGSERWAITYDRASGSAMGNVFIPGREPSFVFCSTVGDLGAIEPGAPDIVFSCYGADPCVSSPCLREAWSFLAEVPIPVSFFLPPSPPVPSSPAELFAYLQSRAYLVFAGESAVHVSAGPHVSAVRTYVNPVLETSLRDGGAPHPVGAAAVKELYDSGGRLSGWAVSVKIDAGSGGSSWYWYEVFSTSDGSRPIEGVGHGACTGCHAEGVDYVRIPFPLQ